MTTGPSSGHSESWYWLQSSHPANRHGTVREELMLGGSHPEDVTWLKAREAQTAQPMGVTNRSPRGYKTANTGRAQGKDPALGHMSQHAESPPW